jgi:hypothetical protein
MHSEEYQGKHVWLGETLRCFVCGFVRFS